MSETRFDTVSTNILLLCDGTKSISEICNNLLQLYNLKLLSHEEQGKITENIVKFIKKQILLGNLVTRDTISKIEIHTTGSRGKYYPKRIVLELTNNCNLHCSHCFRKAGDTKATYIAGEICDDLANKYSGKIYEVQITGGEPLLHPQFIELITKLRRHFKLILMTNATLIKKIPDDILMSMAFIQISIYGVDKTSFSQITESKCNLFEDVLESTRRINKIGILNQVVFIINNIIDYRLESCVLLAKELGAHNVKFGIASPIGRTTNFNPIVKWIYAKNEITDLTNIIADLSEKYQPSIDVYKWDNDQCLTPNPLVLCQGMPNCGAGYTHICITANGHLKSCQFLSDDFVLKEEVTIENLVNNQHVNQTSSYLHYANSIYESGYDPNDVCSMISAIYNNSKI